MKQRTLVTLLAGVGLLSLLLTSCAGWSFAIRGPYGEARSDDGGPVIVHPLPVIVPSGK